VGTSIATCILAGLHRVASRLERKEAVMAIDNRQLLRRVALAVFAGTVALSLGATGISGQTGCVPEDFSAWAVNRGPHVIFLTSIVEIHIDRWSTEREKDRFARTVLKRGPAALLQALRDAAPVGAIRNPMTVPDDVLFAWQEPVVDGGRRIILITDRPMLLWKESMQVQGTEDMFTVIELRFDANGEGEGKATIGSNIGVDRSLDLIELADYAAEPLRLVEVRTKPTTS
jgi:hypothetical protein